MTESGRRELDTIAAEMARDILADPEFRARMRDLIRQAFEGAGVELDAPPGDSGRDRRDRKG